MLLDPDIPVNLEEEEGDDGALLRSRLVVVEMLVLVFLLFLMLREVLEQQDDDDIRSGDVNASTLADNGRIVVAPIPSRMAVAEAIATTTTAKILVAVAAAAQGFIVEIMVVSDGAYRKRRTMCVCDGKKDSEECVYS